jgi:hypothetical protein
MINTPELSEVVNAVALILHGVNEAKADDGRISVPEALSLFASAVPSVARAVSGVRGIPEELTSMTQDDMDSMYFGFLKTLQWNPTDDTRDRFAVCYELASALVIGGLKWRNTVKPPVAEIIP